MIFTSTDREYCKCCPDAIEDGEPCACHDLPLLDIIRVLNKLNVEVIFDYDHNYAVFPAVCDDWDCSRCH